MSEETQKPYLDVAKAAAISTAVLFLYAMVLIKLGQDWWSDENYSHGLLVPFVIGFIVWSDWERLGSTIKRPAVSLGIIAIVLAFLMLFAGTLGAELFTQRISLVLMLAGVIVYLFGTRILSLLAVPFALFLLAIPIPQILFNRIALPLQMWASQTAVWGIRVFDVPTVRKGNVIDILPNGSTQTISLEVVEACSGIRSLMTLVTLSLILAYFTRNDVGGRIAAFSTRDFWRAVVLMMLAVPIAVITNAARVTATGVMTFYYGKQATESTLHEMSGWLVYVVALLLLIGANFVLKKVFGRSDINEPPTSKYTGGQCGKMPSVIFLMTAIFLCGIAVNVYLRLDETVAQRRPLSELSPTLGDWRQKGGDFKFDPQVEAVLKANDYTMREYSSPDGRVANLYVGYYNSQRSGATYHSPQNCLPGSGWVLSDPASVEITTSDGRSFMANRYIIDSGKSREVMLYWYSGRGRNEASEYRDKLNTIWDSVTRRRSDGAMVRVMTGVDSDEAAAVKAATDLSSRLAENLSAFIPE
ncbi:hypothetical protein BH10ACI2_BH10ACI2_22340 [soil metagenome]